MLMAYPLAYSLGIPMSDDTTVATPDPGGTTGHLVRIVFAGLVLAGCIGLPSITAASNLSTSGLGFGSLVKAAFGALVVGAIAAAITRRLVREIWTAWVGVLGGVVPASLVGKPTKQLAAAGAYGLGGLVLVVLGTMALRRGLAAGSVMFGFYGLVTVLVGFAIALAGAIPRLVFARRKDAPAQPDDAVARHVWLFLTLVLAALGLSSGLAETMPAALYRADGIPLRVGAWARGCVASHGFAGTPCPLEQRYRIVGDRDRNVELEWELNAGRCEIVVDEGERRRNFPVDAGWLALHVAESRDIVVSFVGLTMDSCWYRVRVRPSRERP